MDTLKPVCYGFKKRESATSECGAKLDLRKGAPLQSGQKKIKSTEDETEFPQEADVETSLIAERKTLSKGPEVARTH